MYILVVSTSVKSSWGGKTKTKASGSKHPNDLEGHVRVVRHSPGETRGWLWFGFNFRSQLFSKESEREATFRDTKRNDDPDLALFHSDVTTPWQKERDFQGGVYLYGPLYRIYPGVYSPLVFVMITPSKATGRGSLGFFDFSLLGVIFAREFCFFCLCSEPKRWLFKNSYSQRALFFY